MKHILLCLFCLISFVLMANSSIDIQALKQDAQRGDVKAQYALGGCYLFGKGVAQSYPEAIKWLRKAAGQGDANAQFTLGFCYYVEGVQSYPEAVKWYRKAAEQGNADAQYALGGCYYNGEGVAQSYPESVKWCRKAAEQGNAGAQFDLGNHYYNGVGVAQSYPEAVKWYRKAAEQGDANAQFELGLCYARGQGVTKNAFETLKWWEKAAEGGHAEAKNRLAKARELLSKELVPEARKVHQKKIKALEQNDFYSYLCCFSSYGRKNNYDLILKSFKEGVQVIKNGTQLSIRDVQFERSDYDSFYFLVTLRITHRHLSSFNTEIKSRTAFIFEDDNFVILLEQIL